MSKHTVNICGNRSSENGRVCARPNAPVVLVMLVMCKSSPGARICRVSVLNQGCA